MVGALRDSGMYKHRGLKLDDSRRTARKYSASVVFIRAVFFCWRKVEMIWNISSAAVPCRLLTSEVVRAGDCERQSSQCLSKCSNQVSFSSSTSRNLTLVHPSQRLMTLYEPFLADIIHPGALLNALCHAVILNHARLCHKLTLFFSLDICVQTPRCGAGACVDEYCGTDKETKNKPDVVFLCVHLEPCQ